MRTVLITGTSTGFGLVTTVELARRGWRVFATMRNLDRKAPLEAALTQAGVRDGVEISQLDVTDRASVAAAVTAVLAKTGGKLDAVVHNAGVATGGAFEDLPVAELRRVMETNFFGVLELTRALLPTLRAQRKGRIVIVSSESAFAGQPANSIYCASKWAIEGWAESIAFEVAQFGIDVVLVEPGPYVTDIWQSSPASVPKAALTGPGRSTYSARAMRMWRRGDATPSRSLEKSPKCSRRQGPAFAIPSGGLRASATSCAARSRAACGAGSPSSIWASTACGLEG